MILVGIVLAGKDASINTESILKIFCTEEDDTYTVVCNSADTLSDPKTGQGIDPGVYTGGGDDRVIVKMKRATSTEVNLGDDDDSFELILITDKNKTIFAV